MNGPIRKINCAISGYTHISASVCSCACIDTQNKSISQLMFEVFNFYICPQIPYQWIQHCITYNTESRKSFRRKIWRTPTRNLFLLVEQYEHGTIDGRMRSKILTTVFLSVVFATCTVWAVLHGPSQHGAAIDIAARVYDNKIGSQGKRIGTSLWDWHRIFFYTIHSKLLLFVYVENLKIRENKTK